MCALHEHLRRLIAEIDGVSPDQVTLEYIREKRKKMYRDPSHQFTPFRPNEHLCVMNLVEKEEVRRQAWEFLSQFAPQKGASQCQE